MILDKSVELRKSAQVLDSSSYMKKVLITNKVTLHFFITLVKPITCTSFSHLTYFSRMIKQFIALMLIFYSSTTLAETSVNDESIKVGQQIFTTNCSNICHQTPAAKRLKPKQWRIVLNTMQIRMQSIGMPKLTEQQLNQVFDYLKSEH